MTRQPAFTTRQPTGLPAWPIGLLAGVEKSGKSWKAAQASASDMVHRTFWIGVGEDDPDEYGILPGVRFEIVQHDGTYRGILNAILGAAAQPPGPNGEPNLIVLDSITRLWTLLVDNIQETANERARKRGREIPDDGIRPSMDLWNIAKDRWGHVIDALRAHQGPSLVTSRLELVTVMENGEPTRDKWWKVLAEKNLPNEVGFIVQMRACYPEHDDHLAGVRSARYTHPVDDDGKPVPAALAEDWTVEWLWRQLGLADGSAPRQHAHTVVQDEDATRNALLAQIVEAAQAAGVDRQQIANDWAETHNGELIGETTDLGSLELLRDDLRVRAAQPPAEPGQQDQKAAQEPQKPAQEPPAAEQAAQIPAEASAVPEGGPRELVERLAKRLTEDPDGDELAKMYAAAKDAGVLAHQLGDKALGTILMERRRALAS